VASVIRFPKLWKIDRVPRLAGVTRRLQSHPRGIPKFTIDIPALSEVFESSLFDSPVLCASKRCPAS
jgi:hypothetical protein